MSRAWRMTSVGSSGESLGVRPARPARARSGAPPWATALAVIGVAAGCGSTPPQPEPVQVQVHVVRHAEAWKNVADPPAGADPDALTPTGEAQARALGRWLAERGVDVVVASDTGRTRATAAAIASQVGVTPRVSDAFASLRGGTWDGRVAAWAAGRDPRPEGDGESMADGAARALAAIEALVVEGAGVDAVVVVTHGDIVAALVGEAAGTPAPERWARHEVAAGSVSTLHLSGGVTSLVSQGHAPAR